MAKGMYVGVDNKARKVKQMYIGVKKSLPTEYTQIEYIESNGTQYINTGIIGKSGLKIKGRFSPSVVGASIPIGCYNPQRCYMLSLTDTNTIRYGYVDWYTGNKVLEVGKWYEFEIDFSVGYQSMKINGETVISTSNATTFTNNYNLFLFAYNDSGTAGDFFKGKFDYIEIYDDEILVRDYISVKNTNGTVGMLDLTNETFYENKGTGTFIAGSTVEREFPSVARRVKKGYIGIGGVARPFWGDKKLEYYGTITGLASSRSELKSTTIGDYALFAGGHLSSSRTATVDAYNRSLVRHTVTSLGTARDNPTATTVGNYAIFAGGEIPDASVNTDAYDKSLTKANIPTLTQSKQYHGATTIGDYALFGGGSYGSANYTNTVYAFNSSLTQSTPTSLSVIRVRIDANTIGDYALFGGGGNYTSKWVYDKTVDAYNKSLTRTTISSALSTGRWYITTGVVDKYALFAGGYGDSYVSTVDVIDSSLTKITVLNLSEVKSAEMSTTTLGNFALFSGGYKSTVEVFDKSLTRTTTQGFSTTIQKNEGATIGNYAIFAGGLTSTGNSSCTNKAYAYTLV